MTKQPQVRSTEEALRLADALARAINQTNPEDNVIHVARWFLEDSATELRRLHEVNQELLEALQRIKHHFDTDEYAWRIAETAIAKAGEQP